jgi:ArsR family transcriptional regulator
MRHPQSVPIAANLLSYHLRVLREAELIEGSRRGRWIDYRLAVNASSLVGSALRHAGFNATVAQPAGCAETCQAPS